MRLIAILAAMAFGFPAAAYATKPCQSLNEAQFRAKVLDISDTIVTAQIEGYSDIDITKVPANSAWTDVKILHNYRGDAAKHTRIWEWQSVRIPLYDYKKGEVVLLFLQKKDGGYSLTNNSWAECTPSTYALKGTSFERSDFPALDAEKNPQIDIDHLILFLYPAEKKN